MAVRLHPRKSFLRSVETMMGGATWGGSELHITGGVQAEAEQPLPQGAIEECFWQIGTHCGGF